MKRSVFTAAVFLPWLLGTSSGVAADSWACNKTGLTRHVVVYYPDAPARLPCEVFYSKPQENVVPRALWEAANNEGFCEQKAAEFVAKLETWGWQCTPEEAAPVTGSEPGRATVPPPVR